MLLCVFDLVIWLNSGPGCWMLEVGCNECNGIVFVIRYGGCCNRLIVKRREKKKKTVISEL